MHCIFYAVSYCLILLLLALHLTPSLHFLDKKVAHKSMQTEMFWACHGPIFNTVHLMQILPLLKALKFYSLAYMEFIHAQQ